MGKDARSRRVQCWGLAVVGTIIVSFFACRTEQPRVSVEVRLKPQRLYPGQILEMHYRFETAPDFPGIPYRGYVFVHFYDPLDTLQLIADHLPPKSTDTWRPGDVIEYSRRVFIPDFLYPGTYRVVLGIYDTSGTHPRIPLRGGQEQGRRAYQVAQLEILPPPPYPLVRYVEGWYDQERSPVDPTVRWRWTQRRAVAQLWNPRQNARLYVEIETNQAAFQNEPQRVTLTLNGTPLDTFALTEVGPVMKVYPLTAERLGEEDYVTLEIEVRRTFVPVLLGLGQDARELGVRIFHLVLQPEE